MQRLISQLMPFVLFGIALVALAFGIVLLAYLFFFGAVIGLTLFVIAWVRDKFFPPKKPLDKLKDKSKGRVIDSDEWKKL